MNKIYLSHGSLYDYQLMPFFNIASKCGFNGVELIVGRNYELSNISYMKKLSYEFNIPIKVLHCPFNSWQNEYWPRKPHEKLIHTLEMASKLNCEVIVAHTALSSDPEYKNWLINELDNFQAKYPNIKIGIENMPRRYVMFGKLGKWLFKLKKLPFKLRKLLTYDIAIHNFIRSLTLPTELDDFNISLNSIEKLNMFKYVTIDTTHLGTWNCEPFEYLDLVSSKIVHVHISNYKKNLEHCLPNDGILNLKKFLQKLYKLNYDGGISIEVDPSAFKNHRLFESTSKELIDCINFIKQSFNN